MSVSITQAFAQTSIGIVDAPSLQMRGSDYVWGDIDGDGDMDLYTKASNDVVKSVIHLNDGGFNFTLVELHDSHNDNLRLFDFDGDGFLDVHDGGSIYRNTQGENSLTGFEKLFEGLNFPYRWADYDSDGDSDLIHGKFSVRQIAPQVWARAPAYWNQAQPTNATGKVTIDDEAIANDFDLDGDLDVLEFDDVSYLAPPVLLRQLSPIRYDTAYVFTHESDRLRQLSWGDFDSDGREDVFLYADDDVAKIYLNKDDTFEANPIDLPTSGIVATGDMNLDGLLDIVTVREASPGLQMEIQFNEGNMVFNPVISGFTLTDPNLHDFSLVDLDADGDLDVFILYETIADGYLTLFLENKPFAPNEPPTVPTGLQATIDQHTATLSWAAATDIETPDEALAYRVRIGTQPGLSDIMPSQSNPTTGQALVYDDVPRWTGLTRVVNKLPAGTYYWSVQAVDLTDNTSPFSEEATFVSTGPPPADFDVANVDVALEFVRLVEWGDYDADGDPDLLIGDENSMELYQNDAGVFTKKDALVSVFADLFTWTDADNDGDLDILTGLGLSFNDVELLINNGDNTFSPFEIPVELDGKCIYSKDYDQDGRMDIFTEEHIYKNYGNLAYHLRESVVAGTSTVGTDACGWVDLEGDSDIDYLGTFDGAFDNFVFRQDDNGEFVTEGPFLENFAIHRSSWGDYDSDGDDDLLLQGYDINLAYSTVVLFRNDDGVLIREDVFPNRYAYTGSSRWLDFDADGDLDAVFTVPGALVVMENTEGMFTETDVVLPEEWWFANPYWVQLNDDDVPDFFLVSSVLGDGFLSQFYFNNLVSLNTPPAVPGNLQADVSGSSALLSWDAPFDNETLPAGLTYQVQVAKSTADPKGGDVVPGYIVNNRQQLDRGGNVGHTTAWELKGLPNGVYFWTVRAIDPSGALSEVQPALQQFEVTSSSVSLFEPVTFPEVPYAARNQDLNWGDYDNDGDYDLLHSSFEASASVWKTLVYRNDGGTGFTPVEMEFSDKAVGGKWGDFDNDGDLDLAFLSEDNSPRTQIWRNDGNDVFVNTEILLSLGSIDFDQFSWVDFDGDGDLDLYVGSNRFLVNQDTAFVALESNLFKVNVSGADLDDFDGDGDFDIHYNKHVFLNQNATFDRLAFDFTETSAGSWWDYDSDGDPDLFLDGGFDAPTLLENRDGEFLESTLTFPSLVNSVYEIGDFTYDGRPDLVSSGALSAGRQGFVVSFNGEAFDLIYPGIPLTSLSAPTGLHFDGDGRLDIAFLVDDFGLVIYHGRGGNTNTPPSEPTALTSEVDAGSVRLLWDAASDEETPDEALRYNLRIGTTPGGIEVMAPMVADANGPLLIPGHTNAGMGTTWSLRSLPNGTYYWSVQAMDASHELSVFAPEQTFTISNSDLAAFSVEDLGLTPTPSGNVPLRVIQPEDVDRDGDLDLLLQDMNARDLLAHVYLQENEAFADSILVDLPGASRILTAQWGDFDNDNDPDVLSTRINPETGIYEANLLRNDESAGFTVLALPRDSLDRIQSAWVDLDNDGDLDVVNLTVDRFGNEKAAFVYENNGSDTFTYKTLNLPDLTGCSIFPVDYDVDGDWDLLTSGWEEFNCDTPPTLYRNDQGVFEPLSIYNENTNNRASWGDYDQDGDPDLLLFEKVEVPSTLVSGTTNTVGGLVLRNDREAGFVKVFDFLGQQSNERSLSWVDLNNDGWLDIMAATRGDTRAFVNLRDGTFGLSPYHLPEADNGALAWGDFDGDGNADLFIPVKSGGSATAPSLFRNVGLSINTPPEAPSALRHTVIANTVWFEWNSATDEETGAAGLSYDLMVGTAEGTGDVLSVNRATFKPTGNVGYNTRWPLRLSPNVAYHWQVRAVDASFAYSEFAQGEMIVLSDSTSGTNNEDGLALPVDYRSLGNYPNPFKGSTTLVLDLPLSSEVSVVVYDVIGREVYSSQPEAVTAGWSKPLVLRTDALSSGTYFYRIKALAGEQLRYMQGQFIVRQ